MQSWCPEEFDLESADSASVESDHVLAFTGEALAGKESVEFDGGERFRREAGFTDPGTILSHMSQQERTVVFELVEMDVSADYDRREQDLRAELQKAHDTEIAAVSESARQWADEFKADRGQDVEEMAASCARLAVALAEKIVRCQVDRDPEVIARAVETVLHGSDGADDLTVTASPEDAAWLESDDVLRERLGIARVVADRRITRGGCLVAAGDREWNATLEGQLSSLGEVIEEWIATAGSAVDESGGTEAPTETDPGKDPLETPVE